MFPSDKFCKGMCVCVFNRGVFNTTSLGSNGAKPDV